MSRDLVMLLTHPPTASALADAATFVLGERPIALCVADIADVQSFEHEACRIVDGLGIGPDDRVRIFTDLEGSTPWRVATLVAERCGGDPPICNVQLAMVLEALEDVHVVA